MPVTVDLPLVPATPIGSAAALNSEASSSARVIRAAPMRVRGDDIGHARLDRGRGDDDLIGRGDAAAVLREQRDAARAQRIELGGQPAPDRAPRSDPATCAPRPARIIASGIMPEPPMPTKK